MWKGSIMMNKNEVRVKKCMYARKVRVEKC